MSSNFLVESTKLSATSNQIVFNSSQGSNSTTLSAPTPAAPRVVSIDDALEDTYISIDTAGVMTFTTAGTTNQILGAVDTESAAWENIASSGFNVGNYSIGGTTPTLAAWQFGTVGSPGTTIYNIPLQGGGKNFMLCYI